MTDIGDQWEPVTEEELRAGKRLWFKTSLGNCVYFYHDIMYGGLNSTFRGPRRVFVVENSWADRKLFDNFDDARAYYEDAKQGFAIEIALRGLGLK